MIEPFSQLATAKAYPAISAIVGNHGAPRRSYVFARLKADERRADDVAGYLRIVSETAMKRGARIVWICIEEPLEEAA